MANYIAVVIIILAAFLSHESHGEAHRFTVRESKSTLKSTIEIRKANALFANVHSSNESNSTNGSNATQGMTGVAPTVDSVAKLISRIPETSFTGGAELPRDADSEWFSQMGITVKREEFNCLDCEVSGQRMLDLELPQASAKGRRWQSSWSQLADKDGIFDHLKALGKLSCHDSTGLYHLMQGFQKASETGLIWLTKNHGSKKSKKKTKQKILKGLQKCFHDCIRELNPLIKVLHFLEELEGVALGVRDLARRYKHDWNNPNHYEKSRPTKFDDAVAESIYTALGLQKMLTNTALSKKVDHIVWLLSQRCTKSSRCTAKQRVLALQDARDLQGLLKLARYHIQAEINDRSAEGQTAKLFRESNGNTLVIGATIEASDTHAAEAPMDELRSTLVWFAMESPTADILSAKKIGGEGMDRSHFLMLEYIHEGTDALIKAVNNLPCEVKEMLKEIVHSSHANENIIFNGFANIIALQWLLVRFSKDPESGLFFKIPRANPKFEGIRDLTAIMQGIANGQIREKWNGRMPGELFEGASIALDAWQTCLVAVYKNLKQEAEESCQGANYSAPRFCDLVPVPVTNHPGYE